MIRFCNIHLMVHTIHVQVVKFYTNLFLNGQFYFDSFRMRLCPHEPSINQANLQEEERIDLKFTRHSKLASNTQKPLSKQSHHLALWVTDQVTQVSAETRLFQFFVFFQNGYLHNSASELGGRGYPCDELASQLGMMMGHQARTHSGFTFI